MTIYLRQLFHLNFIQIYNYILRFFMFTVVQSSGGNYTCYTCTSVDNSNCKSPSEFNPAGITTQDGCNFCSVSIIQTSNIHLLYI